MVYVFAFLIIFRVSFLLMPNFVIFRGALYFKEFIFEGNKFWIKGKIGREKGKKIFLTAQNQPFYLEQELFDTVFGVEKSQ